MARPYNTNQDLATAESKAHQLWNSQGSQTASKGHPDLFKDWAHWRGHGRWKTDQRWLGEGEKILKIYSALCALHPRPSSDVGRMLEWGPGGGCNTTAFGKLTNEIVGADISVPTLVECKRQMDRIRPEVNFFPFPIAIDDPEAALTLGRFDFILCVAVTQHMPSREWFWRTVDLWRELINEEDGRMVLEFRTVPRGWTANERPETYDENVNRWLTFQDRAEVIDELPKHGWRVHQQYNDGDKSHQYIMMVPDSMVEAPR